MMSGLDPLHDGKLKGARAFNIEGLPLQICAFVKIQQEGEQAEQVTSFTAC